MIDVKRYFHKLYDNVLEFESLSDVQNMLLNDLDAELNQANLNQFIVSCDRETLKYYETMLKIIADPKEDLDFRRKRILNRMSLAKPFTIRFLKQKLDEIIGPGRYEISVDHSKHTMYVESNIISQDWFHEVYVTINKMKPANIVFINKPVTREGIVINEEVSYSIREYNYKLGTTWRLGKKPYKSLNAKGVIKLKNEKSVQRTLLNDLRNTTLNKISYAKINETIKITEFLKKEILDNKIVIEYVVYKENIPEAVTKVDLFDSNNNLLTSIKMYVPVIEDLELKHMLSIEEGIGIE